MSLKSERERDTLLRCKT